MHSFQSRLLNNWSVGLHDLKPHDISPQTLASEVIRVDVHAPVSPLHDAGDKLLGMQGVIRSRKDLAHGPQIATGKPSHPARMNVQLSEPFNAWKGALQGGKDFIRLILVSGIMGRLVRGALSRTGDGEHHVHRDGGNVHRIAGLRWWGRRRSSDSRAKERHAGLKSNLGFENQALKLVENMPGNENSFHRYHPLPSNSSTYLAAIIRACAKVSSAGFQTWPSRW